MKRKLETVKKDTMRRLFTIKEAAEYLGRSVPGMRELLYSRELKCIQGGPKGQGKIWVDIRDLDSWIEDHKSFM
jgi:hypothetical protein